MDPITVAALTKPHDAGQAPPKGFTRYQVEIDVHDDMDSSALLERVQDLAEELAGDVDQKTIYDVQNRASVQLMEG